MSPAPVATSVASTGARPPQTKVNLLKIFPSKYSPKIFGSKYYPLLAIFSTKHKYTSYQLGVSDACEDFRWLNWCKTSWDKGYFSSECFSFLAIFLNNTQIYESSIRCLRRLWRPQLAQLVQDLLGQRLLFLKVFFSFGQVWGGPTSTRLAITS